MPLWRRGTTQETAPVPSPRSEPKLPPDAGPGDSRDHPAQQTVPQAEVPARDPVQAPAGPTGPAQPAQQAGPPQQAGGTTTVTRPDMPAVQAEPDKSQAAQPQARKVKHMRLSGVWVAVVAFAIVLALLLIFIVQNSGTIVVSYLGVNGHLQLGVALLFAAVAGFLLAALVGSARIMELRSTARKHHGTNARTPKTDVKAAKADVKAQAKAARR